MHCVFLHCFIHTHTHALSSGWAQLSLQTMFRVGASVVKADAEEKQGQRWCSTSGWLKRARCCTRREASSRERTSWLKRPFGAAVGLVNAQEVAKSSAHIEDSESVYEFVD